MTVRSRLPYALVVGALVVLLLLVMTAGVAIGSVPIAPRQVWQIVLNGIHPALAEQTWPAVRTSIVLDARLPRVVLAAVVGAGLAACGMVLQAVVRNPLADPMLLGVSSGATVGAVAVLVAGAGVRQLVTLPVAAFVGALAALVAVYFLARSGGRMTTVRLILAGVAVAEVLSAVASLLIVTSDDPHKAQAALRWMLGGLGGATWRAVWIPAVVVLIGVVVLLAVTRPLNLLYTGEEAAASLGLDVHRFRAAMFVVVALMVGAMVAVSGSIGFVGLIMPHAVRFLVGADHRRALPAVALLGAAFLVVCDIAARTVGAPEELPVGVLTALVGGPFFLWLMRRRAPA
ncbi:MULTISPECIES: FecCD family ABC transporter permease [Mycolicibacterium]|uniref:Transport system permease n=4 Tax=Mycolicibacterium TaxID=1866885 RepID=I7GFC8_MYCS2|nr:MULTISPECIES: iron ABC transporter permease [Mycolicibacterium]ABK74012.1 Fe uptake system integral membrane protein [Mycolicibacterium smegmatis MC2 155]AFP42336.1 Transport system permease [Mycolicibacterium smegmatis MC2 155]AIU11060.1 ABC transporter permease [Mycolicibacterium smegmatis MC2 155]AIU17684.1 ABC transporter permease [Mycolicibacterium smegmatis]AIU24308.1 ABC transporter permease [Mycolicibacterium smegmatis]